MKKRFWKRNISLLLAIVLLVMPVILMSVRVDAATPDFYINQKTKTMVIGDTYQFRVSESGGKVIWKTSNKKVVSVTQKGKVTAKKRGTATISASVKKNGKTTTYKCKVSVVTQQSSYVARTINLINKERRKYGRASYDKNTYLQQAAQKRAKEVATRSFSASRPNGTSFTSAISLKYNYVKAGQIIVTDCATPADAVEAWMSSSSSKANILSNRYKDIGVGVYLSDDGYLYWVAIFAYQK